MTDDIHAFHSLGVITDDIGNHDIAQSPFVGIRLEWG